MNPAEPLGYWTQGGRFANTLACNIIPAALLASTPATATFSSTPLELGDRGTVRVTQNVTAVSGTTPTLSTDLQTSPDGVSWTTVASFTEATGVGSEYQVVSGIDRFVRAVCTIGGTTPAFTFSITGEAV